MIVAGGDTVRHWAGIVGVLLLAASLVAGCSSADGRPSEFDGMPIDEVGCTVLFGSDTKYVVGPLGPSDFDVIEPNDYTMLRIGRTALDIIVVVKSHNAGMDASIPLDSLPEDGVVAQSDFRDAGNPGYKVTCWRGED